MVTDDLHGRVASGEHRALEEVAERYFCVILQLLRRRFPLVDEDFLVDAAEDCILDYGRTPTRFDPSRGVPLERFLLLVAARDVINHLRSESSRTAREYRYATEQWHLLTPIAPSPSHASAEFLSRLLALVPRQNERAALLMWLMGAGKTQGLAEVLGFGHVNGDRQRKEVRRFKDRIKRRVTRARGRQLL